MWIPTTRSSRSDSSFEPLSGLIDLWRGESIEKRATIPTRQGNPSLVFPPAAFDWVFVKASLTKAPWLFGPSM